MLTGSIAQTDQTWVRRGPVDLDSVSVTMTSAFTSRQGGDAVHLEPGCTGRRAGWRSHLGGRRREGAEACTT